MYPKSECAGALAGALVLVEVVLVVLDVSRNVAGAALIDGLLAVPADEARVAVAFVVIDKVEADAAVLARHGGAVIHILAVLAPKAPKAVALVVIIGDHVAGTPVMAERSTARVHLLRKITITV